MQSAVENHPGHIIVHSVQPVISRTGFTSQLVCDEYGLLMIPKKPSETVIHALLFLDGFGVGIYC